MAINHHDIELSAKNKEVKNEEFITY